MFLPQSVLLTQGCEHCSPNWEITKGKAPLIESAVVFHSDEPWLHFFLRLNLVQSEKFNIKVQMQEKQR